MTGTIITPINDTSYDVSVSFTQGHLSKTVSCEICATLDNGVTCCDTFSCTIHGFLEAQPCDKMDIIMHVDMRGADYILNPGLVNSPSGQPLYIAIYDEWGNLYRVLHNNIPVSAEGSVHYGDLPVRLYNMVFQWDEYLEVIPILDTGIGIDHTEPNE